MIFSRPRLTSADLLQADVEETPDSGLHALLVHPVTGLFQRAALSSLPETGGSDDLIIGTFTTGEAIPSSSLIHVDASGVAWKADRSLNRPANGFSIAGAGSGNPITVTRTGSLTGLSGRTTGRRQWLGTGGLMDEDVPTSGLLQSVGIAETAASVFVTPGEFTVLA